jgi:hypothetical protein
MKALEKLGSTLPTASYDDPTSLTTAFAGAHIMFAITDFAAVFSITGEYAQGKNIVGAASQVPKLEHFVWSGMPDTVTQSKGKYTEILHCQAKVTIWRYVREELPSLPVYEVDGVADGVVL